MLIKDGYKSIMHKIVSGFRHQISTQIINNHSQIKVFIKTTTDSFYFYISKVNNSAFHKGTLLLTDGGESLLNQNYTNSLSSYLAVCNFQLGFQIDYLSTSDIKSRYQIRPVQSTGYELLSISSSHNVLQSVYKFVTILETIRSLNMQHYFK